MDVSALARLRELAVEMKQYECLRTERNRCIREAFDAGFSQRRIAAAAGLTQPAVRAILKTR